MARIQKTTETRRITDSNRQAFLLLVAIIIGSIAIGSITVILGFLWSYVIFATCLLAFTVFFIVRTPFRFLFLFLLFIPINVYLIRFSELSIGPYSLLGSIKDVWLLTLVAWILSKALLTHHNFAPQTVLSYLILLFVAWASIQSIRNDVLIGLVSLRIVVQFTLAYFVVKLTVHNTIQAKQLLSAFMWGGSFALFISLTEVTNLSWSVLGNSSHPGGRLIGVFPQVNMQGVYLGIIVIVGIYFLVRARNRFEQITTMFFELTAITLLVLTFSRRAWVGVVVGLLVGGGIRLRNKNIWRFNLLIIILGAFLLLLSNQLQYGATIISAATARLGEVFSDDSGDYVGISYRVNESENLWDQITQSPDGFLFGQGLGAFGTGLLTVTGEGTLHNSYLSLWAQMGLFGLSIFLTIMFVTFYQGIAVVRSRSKWAQICGASLASLTLLLVASFFGDMLGNYPFNFFLWFFTGIIGVAYGHVLKTPHAKAH